MPNTKDTSCSAICANDGGCRYCERDTVDSYVAGVIAAGLTVELIGIMEGKYQRVTVLKVIGGESPIHATIAEPIARDPMDFPRPMGVAPYHGPHLRNLPQPLGASLRRAP